MNEVLKQLCTLYAINGESGCWDKDTKTRGKPCNCELSRSVKIAIAARDKWWIEWAESQCPHGGIDSGGLICLECYQCWKDRKREVGQ